MLYKKPTNIDGVYEIRADVLKDNRGQFTKIMHEEWLMNIGIPNVYGEEYCSVSHKRVLRGMHFQKPPYDHAKLVYCAYGEILDVAVDLRKGSSTFGKYASVVLSHTKGNMTYIPTGFAHGFYTLSDIAVVMCKQSSVFNQEADAGICWDSLGIEWPEHNPILSKKDENNITFNEFESPFI